MRKLDCHGGTTFEDIENLFNEMELLCEQDAHSAKRFVFLDEINTCVHVDLITEIIINHSLNGRGLHPNIVVLAALNPYRFKTQVTDHDNITSGLTFSTDALHPAQHSSIRLSSGIDRNLVYKVHPVPDTLLCFVYDFGALDSPTEALYIRSMILRELSGDRIGTGVTNSELQMFANALFVAQRFSRQIGGDASVVSLRDVKRCIRLVTWFENNPHNEVMKSGERKKPLSWTGSVSLRAYTLAIALVYYYRLQERSSRRSLWEQICQESAGRWPIDASACLAVIGQEEALFCDNLVLEGDIATNEAIRENIFVTITCVSTRIPVILVGKPGSSKTLTVSVIESNLRGTASPNSFWRHFPSVTVYSYQCSPLSKAQGILSQYQKACRFQENQNRLQSVTILLLDEIGLAEHSPDMPLKILHQILPEEKISIIGISNWVLDPAKMNRAILINRPDPTAADLELTGNVISNIRSSVSPGSSTVLDVTVLKCLARAFHAVYTQQAAERPFYGMRDYYSLLKLIRRTSDRRLGWKNLMRAICRNFGGQTEFLQGVISAFMVQYAANRSIIGHFFGATLDRTPLSAPEMIAENLSDPAARHLMVITNHKEALQVMIGCGLISYDTTDILIGSQFPDDGNEYTLVASVNKVKHCMARGKTLLLIDHSDMYESLYDVLNQRTVTKEQRGGMVRMLRLAIGANSHLCPVSPRFRVVVMVGEDEAYSSLDVPLLSRFEKQNLSTRSVVDISSSHSAASRLIERWIESMASDIGMGITDIFPRYYPGFVSSYVLALSKYDDKFWPPSILTAPPSRNGLREVQPFVGKLVHCMTPLAVAKIHACDEAAFISSIGYFKSHESLGDLVSTLLLATSSIGESQNGDCVALQRDITLTAVRTWSQSAVFFDCVKAINSDIKEKLGEIAPTLHIYDFIHLPSCEF